MGSVYKPKYKDKKTGDMHESSVWWIKYYRDGVPMRESSGSKRESDAKRLLQLREGDIARGVPVMPRLARIKFGEIAEDVTNDYRANGRRSLRDLQMRLRLHVLPFFGERRTAAITTADVNKYVVKRREEAASNGEINRELTAVKRAFSLASNAGKILTAPYIPMLKENNIRTGFFEREQFEALRKHLPVDLRAMVTFAYITGWRTRSEIQRLQWHQVDFEARTVRLDPGTTKNDEGRLFPFTEELRALLEEQRAKTDALKRSREVICPWVFHRQGKPILTFRRSWKTARKDAGVPGCIPHDFRRTAVRNLVRAGVPEAVAMKMTGHKTLSVFERYNIVSEGDLFDAAKRLDAAVGKVSHFQRAIW